MKAFLFSALYACLAQAAILHRAECNNTAVVTVTTSPITELSEDNYVTYYTTTSVTIEALAPTSNAALAARTPKARKSTNTAIAVCTKPSTTITTTLPASTKTVTTTYTYSEALRATATAAACDPSANYGLFNGSLNINQQGALPSTQTFPNLTIAECCDACFTSAEGCLAWSLDGAPGGDGVVHEGCSMNLLAGGCPAVSGGTEVIMYPNDEKTAIGVGPCDVEVAYFVDG